MMIIYWICGGSGAGKETFIRNVLKNPSEYIVYVLKLKGKKLVGIEASMKHIGQYSGDPVVNSRKKIFEEVGKHSSEKNVAIFIKYQSVDEDMDLLNKLKKQFPKAEHKIIFLKVNINTLFKRCQKKSWWTEEFEKGGVMLQQDWLDGQIKQLKEHKDFEITAIDSNTVQYKPSEFP